MMRQLYKVVDLQVLTSASRAAINRDDSAFIENIGMKTAGAAFSERSDELPDAILRHEEICREHVGTHFEQIGPLGFAAHVSHLSPIQQEMCVFVTPGKPLPYGWMVAIHD